MLADGCCCCCCGGTCCIGNGDDCCDCNCCGLEYTIISSLGGDKDVGDRDGGVNVVVFCIAGGENFSMYMGVVGTLGS